MKNRQKYLTIFIVMTFIVLCAAMITPVFADVGNSFSGGNGSSGGGYSGSSGGYHSYGSGIGSFFFFSNGPTMLIFVVLFLVYLLYQNKGNHGHARSNAGVSNMVSNAGIDEDAVVAQIQQEDASFSRDHFKTYAKEVWLSVQEAWEAKDWQKVRPFESNTLFNIHNRQLQEYIDMHKTNYMNMQNIRSTTLAAYRIDSEYEVLVVKLDASLLDYIVDDESGKVIAGSRDEFVHRSYRLEFIRKKGVKTKTQEGNAVTNCPNCGAPTQITSSGVCEYCKSMVTNGDFDWVLNAYEPWR